MMLANKPGDPPVGESLPNSEVFRRLRGAHGFDEPCFRDSDEDICRSALTSSKEAMRGIEWNALKKAGWQKLRGAAALHPLRAGGSPTASGKCEFYSEWLEKQGVDPLPFYNPPVEAPGADTELARKYPLAFNLAARTAFLNRRSPTWRGSGSSSVSRHRRHASQRRRRRGIRAAIWCASFNDRGGYTLRARINGSRVPAW